VCAGDYVKYAHGLISDYLPADLCKQLSTSLGFEFFIHLSLCICLSVRLSDHLLPVEILACDNSVPVHFPLNFICSLDFFDVAFIIVSFQVIEMLPIQWNCDKRNTKRAPKCIICIHY